MNEKENANAMNHLGDCPCRTCGNDCTSPFDCKRFLQWCFEDFKDVTEQIHADVSRSKIRCD